MTVIISSYQRLARLPALIDEYTRQGADEVIVVLDGPHPGWERAVPAHAHLRVVELSSNHGLALARIAGLRAATSDVVLAVDDDVEPGPTLVERHRSFHADHVGDVVLQGYMPVALPARRSRDEAPTYLYSRDYETQVNVWRRAGSTTILKSLWGGNLSLSRDLYERAEAVKSSERLEYNEDLDLGLRLLKLGATATFDEHAYATHHHSRNLNAFLRESLVRGGAIADLERRWGYRPAQLTPLVATPSGGNPIASSVQDRICRHDHNGLTEYAVVAIYRLAGLAQAWRVQDAATRLLRRGMIMRGYRLASG